MRLLSGLLVGLVFLSCGERPMPVQPAAVEEDSGVPRAKTQAQADARAALADRGISFRVSEFLDAAAVGDLSVVELFVEGGMPIDAAFGGWTALHEAARNGHLLVVQYLIDQGASVDRSVRALALRGGHTEVVQYVGLYLARARGAAHAALADRGIAYTDSAFFEEAGQGNLEVVKLFVEAGMSVNARDHNDYTALHWAAARDRLETVKYLVGAGADVNTRDEDGDTVLHSAAFWGNLAVVEFLVGAGADVNATENIGETVLHRSARFSLLEMVKFLVGVGADVNAANKYGWTPLHLAATKDLEMVEFLVGAGAVVDATDDDGKTPRDWAARCSRTYDTDEKRANCAAVVEYFDSLDDDE